MAKHTVTYDACGHTVEHENTGPQSDRARRIENLENMAHCPDCVRRAQAAKSAEALATRAAAIAADPATVVLPTLVGSEKQIAWALTLRKDLLQNEVYYVEDQRERLADRLEEGRLTAAEVNPQLADLDAALTMLRSQSSARFWIDARNADRGILTKEFLRKIAAK